MGMAFGTMTGVHRMMPCFRVLFIDRSVLEVFASETVCATKVISPLGVGATLELQTRGGIAQAKRVQCWPVKTIW